MNWELYKYGFHFDGSYLDMYAFETSIDEWQKVLDWLEHSVYKIEYKVGGKFTKKVSAKWIFENYDNTETILYVQFGSDDRKFWSITSDESAIEFTVFPPDIDNAEMCQHVFDFMRGLGKLLTRNTYLSFESAYEAAIEHHLFMYDFATNEIIADENRLKEIKQHIDNSKR
jgi:hypothetical protein